MEQDWANLNYYQEANEDIRQNENWPTVIFMGNSITEGWMDQHPEFFLENNYLSRGIGGQTTPQMLLRFMQDVVDLRPETVVILAGTNDIAENTGPATLKSISNNIRAMVQLADKNDINVILCSVLPVSKYPWNPGLKPVEKIGELNTWLKEFAEENAHIYADLFSPMANEDNGMKEEYSADGVHPNLKAYKKMETLIQSYIEKSLDE